MSSSTNKKGRWTGALAALLEDRRKIDDAFAAADLPRPLEWTEQVTAGRWVIRYRVDLNYQDEPDRTGMLELNLALGRDEACLRPVRRGTRSSARRRLLGQGIGVTLRPRAADTARHAAPEPPPAVSRSI